MADLTKTQVQNSQENGKESVGKVQHFSYAVQLVTSVSLPMVLHTAVKLKLFEIIAKAGNGKKLSPAQIASQLPTKNPNAASMLDRMLLFLSSHSVVTCDVLEVAGGGDINDDHDDVQCERVYGLAPVGELFVPDEEGSSVGHMLELIQDKILMRSWDKLENAVLEEGPPPFDRAHGMNIYEYAGKDPRLTETIIKGVVGLTIVIVKQLLIEYKGFEQIQTLVDVGGGPGIVLYHITSKYPSIKAINFDLPLVVKHAPAFPGVEHIGGDMFDSVPGGDAILLKDIMHDWSDDKCLALLKNCHKALPEKGKVIVVDFVRPEKPDTSISSKQIFQTDLLKMTQNSGGKVRSEKEFRALAIAAGFRGLIKFQYLACNVGVIDMYK